MADDSIVLLLNPWQEAGHVHERDDRDVESIAHADEPCSLVGRVDVQRTGETFGWLATMPTT